MKKFLLLASTLFSIYAVCSAQFEGGNSDGFATDSHSTFVNPSALLYGGGDGDGFDFATVAVALPVELSSFEAIPNSHSIWVRWTTQTEIENDFFLLEKSKDLKEFEVVANVKGAGNSLDPNNYTYEDIDPFSGENHYRLKIVDFDGSFQYSNWVSAFFKPNDLNFGVYPNPFKDELTVSIENPNSLILTFELFNSKGEIVRKISVSDSAFISTYIFNVENLPSGIYFLRFKTENQYKIIKVKKL